LETKKQLEEKKQQAAKTRDAKIAAYYKEHGPNKLSRDPSAVGKIKADYERTASRLDKRIDRIEQTAKVAGAVADLEAKYFELTGGGQSRMQVPTTDTLDDTAAAHAGYFQLNDRLGATRTLGEIALLVGSGPAIESGVSIIGKQFARQLARRGAETGIEIVAQNGTKITRFTKHGINRAIGDGAERAGVKPDAILDALKNPKGVAGGLDQKGRPFQIFTGENARVVVNPQSGEVVSMNPLSGAGAH
jgi:hypothetical protein